MAFNVLETHIVLIRLYNKCVLQISVFTPWEEVLDIFVIIGKHTHDDMIGFNIGLFYRNSFSSSLPQIEKTQNCKIYVL